MKKNLIKLFQLLFVVLILLFLFNCQESASKQGDDDPIPDLVGEWLSSFNELFVINEDDPTPMFYSQFGGVTSYAGTIVEHDNYSGSNGYITIQYTENSFDPAVINKFYRIHWKALAVGICKISGAFRADLAGSAQYSADTLADAKNNFTVEAGAFSAYSDCIKQ